MVTPTAKGHWIEQAGSLVKTELEKFEMPTVPARSTSVPAA
jgi:hypothetical protein